MSEMVCFEDLPRQGYGHIAQGRGALSAETLGTIANKEVALRQGCRGWKQVIGRMGISPSCTP